MILLLTYRPRPHLRGFVTTCCFLFGACANVATEGTDSAARLSRLTLTPAAVTLFPGAQQQFAVTGSWSDGSSLTPPVTYLATGGTISTIGLYSAGGTAGTFRVEARHAASGLADTSTVAVTQQAATILLREDFEDDTASARGWYDNVNFTTTTAEHVDGSTRSLAWTWAQGQTLPAFGGTARHAIAPTESLYVSYWVKYSTNWIGSGDSYHPHEFYILTTASDAWVGPSYTPLTTYIEHNYQNGGIPIIATSDGLNVDVTRIGLDLTNVTESRSTAGCNGNSDGIATDCYALGGGLFNNGKVIRPAGNIPAFAPTPGPGYKGDWHHVEVVLRMNTIVGGVGRTDGIAQYWFDGTLLIDRRNVLFRTGARPTMRWNQFLLGPYIGSGSPVSQSAWIDNLVVAKERP